MTDISVILCVRNGAATIAQQLGALAAQDYPGEWELVVVDNGSTDGTLEIVEWWRSSLPDVRVVPAQERAGLGYARNVGARAARGRVLAFCDADDVAEPGWLTGLLAASQDSDLIAGSLDHERLNSELARSWRQGGGGPPVLRPALGYLPYAPGANFAVRRQAFESVGGCDEQFTICGDDFDLSWRIQQAGGRLVLASEAVMHYRLRESLREVMRQRYRYGYSEAMLRNKFRDVVPPMAGRVRRRAIYRLLARSWYLLGGRRRRGAWLALASNMAGQVRGALRYRLWA